MSEIKPAAYILMCPATGNEIVHLEPTGDEWEAELFKCAALAQARAEERERHQPLRQAAEDFIAKVDRGEARSKRTYAALKDAIRALDERTEK